MKNSTIALLVLVCLMISCKQQKPRVLVFSKTMGYRHQSIGAGKLAIMELGKQNNFDVDTTEDASLINEENLKHYNAVIFLSTTQDVLDVPQQNDFKRFIQAGGGFVGIHAAADTEYEWPWYGKLVGAYFLSHPKTQEATITKVKPFGTNATPDTWTRTDEWYNYKNIADDINVIYNLDETSYEGGKNGSKHPIAWYHEFDGGRSFYTGLGHTEESYADSLYRDHLLQGIKYALGESSKLDYAKAKAKRAPEENRFTKVVLDFNLNEPTEMVVLPDNAILFIERKGDIKIFDQTTNKTEIISTIPVNTKYNPDKEGNLKEAEDGLLGAALDPNFKENHWIYLYYSPQGPDPKNILTRYTLNDRKLDEASKKVILEIPVQRDQCCHTGGSIAFDAKGNLFLSTGDNTSPFESNGFSPSDEQSGRGPFDAQKSSSNTNDLRGKIIRIHPEPDGTYTIPEGNLFPKGEDKTRPEIYVMGNRNPYRISIDQKTGYLYWGEVGPDAGQNDSLRGPRGYDEVNQARQAGFFGWPYFVGKNYAYAKYDFATKKIGPVWDPSKPINESPNNTGKTELPSVSPPFIWYPYAKSDEFPMAKTGGRNAMAGPVYYSENYSGVPTAFPDYFDGKLLIYDWIRNWMFLVSMDSEGAITDIEPFMAGTKFNNIIDMTYGPDGRLYMIEYGTKWFAQNIDARLVRIDYNGGNRPPVAQLAADKISGSVPLSVKFDAEGSKDYDPQDKITYSLEAGGKTYSSTDGKFDVTFDKPGVYNAKLKIADDKGLSSAATVQVTAGNEPPLVAAALGAGNQTFYFPGKPVQYNINVSDKEDGSSSDGKISAQDVQITFDYVKGFDMVAVAQGHQMPTAELPGKALISKSDCKSCHLVDQRSAGPGYHEVADKYKGKSGAADILAAKVVKGGSGVWGTTEMAAHPQISVEDAKKMVEYILSLGDEKPLRKLPLSGTVIPGKETDGAYILTASYHDKGANGVPSLSSTQAIALRSPLLQPHEAADLRMVRVVEKDGREGFENVKNEAHAGFKDLDLTGIKRATLTAFLRPEQVGGEIEVRLDKPDGKLIGIAKVSPKPGMQTLSTVLESSTGRHDLYLVFKNADAGDKSLFYSGGIHLLN